MAKYEVDKKKLIEAITLAGGTGGLALKINVSYQSVIDWKSGRKNPSQVSCMKIEKATEGKVKACDLLPDYPWDALR